MGEICFIFFLSGEREGKLGTMKKASLALISFLTKDFLLSFLPFDISLIMWQGEKNNRAKSRGTRAQREQ